MSEMEQTKDKKTRMIGLLARVAGEAAALDVVRMMVKRPGVTNGVDWQKWWNHPSWKELDRLNKQLEALLDSDPELQRLHDEAADAEL